MSGCCSYAHPRPKVEAGEVLLSHRVTELHPHRSTLLAMIENLSGALIASSYQVGRENKNKYKKGQNVQHRVFADRHRLNY